VLIEPASVNMIRNPNAQGAAAPGALPEYWSVSVPAGVTMNVAGTKAGTAAPTGTETTPAPDAGYAGIAVVTVANGQSSIINSNIAPYGAVAFIPAKLAPAWCPASPTS
jgi:hypothetical protein